MSRWFVFAALIAVASTALSLGIYSANYEQMPEQVPIHWNLQGEPDRFTSRDNLFWYTLILPGTTLLLMGIWLALPWLSPKGYSIDNTTAPATPTATPTQTPTETATDPGPATSPSPSPGRQSADIVLFLAIVLISYLGVVTTASSVQVIVSPDRWIIVGVSLFFAALGLVIGRVPRNFYVGIRTPWTLADPTVWEATHRFSGRVFFLTGLLGAAMVVVGLPAWSPLPVILLMSLVTVVYSLVVYKRLERAGQLTNSNASPGGQANHTNASIYTTTTS